ncbi:MAG: GTP-binding protein [Sedimentibacter sp.]
MLNNLSHHHHVHDHHCNHANQNILDSRKIPITIIGGFLGAGKTSVVNNIISKTTEKVDVLVREFGSVSIDDMLIHLDKRNIHVFPGISIHHDPQLMLYGYLDALHEKSKGTAFDHLLMELSGLDTPEHLVQLFFLDKMRKEYSLNSFIAIVDAEYGQLNLDEYPVAIEQIAYADMIIINKLDLVSDEQLKKLTYRIQKINSYAKIFYTTYGEVELSKTLNVDLNKQLYEINHNSPQGDDDILNDNIKTVVLSENSPMDKEKTNRWIQNLFVTEGMNLLRSKGILNFLNSDYRYEFQAVRKTFHSKADRLWESGEERKSVVVLIGEGLDDEKKYQESFHNCIANGESQI